MQKVNQPILNDQQIDQYHDQGFVLVESVFNPHELDQINAALDALPASDESGHTGWQFSLGQKDQLTQQVCQDARLLDLISPLVHPGIAIFSAKLTCKEPHDPTVCHWHQDDMYYIKFSESTCRLSVYIALQDIDREMGCLQVIPGSHRTGLEKTTLQESGTCRLSLKEPPILEQSRYVPMKAGDVLIFSALLHHGSAGNATSRRRRVFIVSYQEATAVRGNGKQWKILRSA